MQHHQLSWWKQSIIARELGRKFFRIHGTGLNCEEAVASYFPFVRTSGCIAQREVSGQFADQRILLDEMMKAMELKVTFENETILKGVLYIIEVSDQERAILLKDYVHLLD